MPGAGYTAPTFFMYKIGWSLILTTEQLAKMQAGRAAAQAAKQSAALSEEDWHAAIHKQAYIDLLRYRAQNTAVSGEQSEPSFLNID